MMTYIFPNASNKNRVGRIYGMVRNYPVIFIEDISEELLLTAGRFKAKNLIAYADVFAAATTKIKGAVLITGDPEFKQIEDEIDILWV